MTLMIPLLEQPIVFAENRIQLLVVENQPALRQLLEALHAQTEGQAGDLILAERFEPQDFSRLAVLIMDPFCLDTGTKRFAAKLQQAVAEAAETHEAALSALYSQLYDLASQIAVELDFSAAFDPIEDPSVLVKLLGFRLDVESLPFSERILEWMVMQRNFFGKQLFVFFGLKSYLSDEGLRLFYRSVFYEKLSVLLIESCQRETVLQEEQTTIVDEDLCVLT